MSETKNALKLFEEEDEKFFYKEQNALTKEEIEMIESYEKLWNTENYICLDVHVIEYKPDLNVTIVTHPVYDHDAEEIVQALDEITAGKKEWAELLRKNLEDAIDSARSRLPDWICEDE